ncbi:MAG: AmmeMemoRadiSam system radical SAM enzyme [Chitinispirillia bacterium]|nr:AmmeMemoRadiSam system radical SAM enzyme [Chitinispirillia bacterium]
MKEAILWESVGGKIVVCSLCAHRCRITPGNRGVCSVRKNIDGSLYTYAYGHTIAENIDPVEKKPLYHFLPKSITYSIAAAGCNFRCGFCQNWNISQISAMGDTDKYRGDESSPEKIVEKAIKHGCESISFTYTEPTIFFEYALDIAKIAKQRGLKTIFVSNGYMTSQALEMISPYLDACNIDLKSFSDDFYKKQCGASLQPVLDSLKLIKKLGIWLEVTTLVITGENNSDDELKGIAKFIADDLGKDVPWHVSRFFPQYKFADRSVTLAESVKKALKIGHDAGLSFVHAGNIAL